MNPGWTYLTLERTQMNKWTRKRRLKFRKRWRKQHHGQNFFWMAATWKWFPLPEEGEFTDVIFYKRQDTP